ncbi:hypothetical protein AAEI00_02655 [Shewanella algae]
MVIKKKYPATIEALCSPYMIMKHGPITEYKVIDGKPIKTELNQSGYVIYYNETGGTDKEFVYLFDVLSKLQILSSQELIKLRVANLNVNDNIRSNFERAKNIYVADWGLDGHRRIDLDRIEFDIVPATAPNYSPGILAWRIHD